MWSRTVDKTVGGSRVSPPSMAAEPVNLSARSFPQTPLKVHHLALLHCLTCLCCRGNGFLKRMFLVKKSFEYEYCNMRVQPIVRCRSQDLFDTPSFSIYHHHIIIILLIFLISEFFFQSFNILKNKTDSHQTKNTQAHAAIETNYR